MPRLVILELNGKVMRRFILGGASLKPVIVAIPAMPLLGAKLSRYNLEIFQKGEQTETTLNGLTVIAGQQWLTLTVRSLSTYGTSRQLHKCIVADRAHAVFNGKVFVPKPAQLTDAGQLNRNLLLSPRARVDTKPQLEIIADNVKCAHGATVSQLDDESLLLAKPWSR